MLPLPMNMTVNARRYAVVCIGLAALSAVAVMAGNTYLGDFTGTALLFVSGLFVGAAIVFGLSEYMIEKEGNAPAGDNANAPGALNWAEILGAMPDAAIVVDRSFVVLRYNAAAQHLFNLLQTGLPIEQAVRDPELFSAVARALEFAETREAHLASRGAAEQRLTAVVTPVRGSSKQRAPAAALITVRDESEQ